MRGRRAPDKRCLDSAGALPLNAGRMAIEPAMSGEIPPDGVLEILREIEEQRITGRLRFTARSADGSTQTGEVELVYEHGQLLAIRVDGRDDGDLSHAFGWNDGTFRIAVNAKARTLVPQLVEEDDDPAAREPTTQFVRPRTVRDDTGCSQ